MDELREDQDKERERLKQTISDIESQLQKANIKVKLLTNRCVVGPWYVFLSIIIIYMYLYIFIFVYIYIYIYIYNRVIFMPNSLIDIHVHTRLITITYIQ